MINWEKIHQERNLEILVRNGGFKFTDNFFPYTSGKIGPYFVQSADVMKNGADYFQACHDMEKMISNLLDKSQIEVISGGETRDWIFSNTIAAYMKKPPVMLYKNGKTIGADMREKKVIHVADLNNEGSSPRDFWIPIIKKAGGDIENIFFYVDRMENGIKVMKELNLKSYALVKLDKKAWNYLKNKNIIGEKIYNSLRERSEDSESWAINMLKSEKGIKKLGELFEDSLTKEKAEKILEIGYPELKDELYERLKIN